MENLIKVSEQYLAVTKEEDINPELFNEVMRKLTEWDYHCITREHYLSLSSNEKEAMVKKFYYEMKDHSSAKKFIFIIILEWC